MLRSSLARTVALTAFSLAAFAGNSLLCRMALAEGAIDPWSFTALRIASGAVALLPFLGRGPKPWSPRSAAALLAYAVGFSLAYITLDAGTGALLLFGAVQGTMIGVGVARGERPSGTQTLGIALAVAGLVWLVLPGVRAPDSSGAAMMVGAGMAWGVYSLIGRGVAQPARATACNFVLAAPFALLALVPFAGSPNVTAEGALLAMLSGALTSGLGYVLWYATLPRLTATRAAVVQLAVPVLAALGGVAFLGEEATVRLVGAGALTLGGVGLAVIGRRG